MKRTTQLLTTSILTGLLFGVSACGGDDTMETFPKFSLAWSEYPSWSVFGVADELGMIDGREGEMGPIEAKWQVDIVLTEADYDGCIQHYSTGSADAACLTNMDSLSPSVGRKTVAILPTSTSVGADALLVYGIDDINQLKGKKVLGLEKSVSEYCFVRNLELLAEKEEDYTFSNMDPGQAAIGMQQGKKGFEAIVVWNPFVMDTLTKRPGSKVLFDSTTIPGEILDLVVMNADSLAKEGGDRFACAVIDTFYAFSRKIEDPDQRSDMIVALGEKFSALDAESMETVLKMTVFYDTPAKGIALFDGDEIVETMQKVTEFCVDHDIVDTQPSIGFGSGSTDSFAFDATYIKRVRDRGDE